MNKKVEIKSSPKTNTNDDSNNDEYDVDNKNDVNDNDENDLNDEKNEDLPNVLPGTCNLPIKYKINEDLKLLQQQYKNKYQPLIERKFIDLIKDIDVKKTMTVMQWNGLADGLSGGYLNEVTEKDFIDVDKECLQWTYRGIRLVEVIINSSPDILCLEECDNIAFFKNYLEPLGYSYEYHQKPESPVRHLAETLSKLHKKKIELPNDGVALFFKKDKFEIAGKVQKVFSKELSKSFALVVPLRYKFIKNVEFLTIVTHLKSSKTQEGEVAREQQVNALFGKLIQNEKKLPIIMCGDLNANPIKNKNGYDPLCYNTLTTTFQFESCYKIALGDEPAFTTCKKRKQGVDQHCIDYIFKNSKNWKVVGYLPIPEEKLNFKPMVPNWHYPSDHFALMIKLFWNDKSQL